MTDQANRQVRLGGKKEVVPGKHVPAMPAENMANTAYMFTRRNR